MQIITSKIIRTHPSWRYLWPLQSGSQFMSYIVTLAAGLFGLSLIVRAVDPAAPFGPILLGAAAGGSLSLYAVLPGRFEITRNAGAESVGRIVQQYLRESAYVLVDESETVRRYRPVGLRWQRWEEAAITICTCNESTIRVTGPVLVLHGIRRMLGRKRLAVLSAR